MKLYTLGFTKKNAREFFEILSRKQIKLLLDVRLNNKSQLAGFTKSEDLKYFLETICSCDYLHCPEFAPSPEILDEYKDKKISWQQYTEQFLNLMNERDCIKDFSKRFADCGSVVLLCSEPNAADCHRGLLGEMIANQFKGVVLEHL